MIDPYPREYPQWAVVLRKTVLVAGEWLMDALYVIQADKAAARAYLASRTAAYWIADKTRIH
jgi:hypothetical protein